MIPSTKPADAMQPVWRQAALGRRTTHSVDSSRSADSKRRFQLRKAVLHAAVGFGIGVLVFHPVSMAVFGWLGIDPAVGSFALGTEFLWRSYTIHMVPMGLVFGLFGSVIGGMDGYYRSAVHFQRNELARQLALNEELRGELEVQNERLRDLEAAKRRSTRFLVHDLKTHLGCVLGFAELLRKGATEQRRDEDRQTLDRILRQARHMLRAVTDLLEIARLQEAPTLDLAVADAPSLLHEALQSVDAPGLGDRIQLGVRHADCPSLRCDKTLVVRALANLVTNAFTHNPPGVNVVLDAAPTDGEVVFSCQDDGPGIPAESVPSLFEEFVSKSDRPRGETSGLGLAFCKAAVEAHGGRIWCESERGHGTTFRFTVPAQSETT